MHIQMFCFANICICIYLYLHSELCTYLFVLWYVYRYIYIHICIYIQFSIHKQMVIYILICIYIYISYIANIAILCKSNGKSSIALGHDIQMPTQLIPRRGRGAYRWICGNFVNLTQLWKMAVETNAHQKKSWLVRIIRCLKFTACEAYLANIAYSQYSPRGQCIYQFDI